MPNNPEESEWKLADDTTVTGSMPKNTYIQSMHAFRCICTANDCIGDLQALFTKYNLFKVKDLYWKQVISAKEEGGKVNVWNSLFLLTKMFSIYKFTCNEFCLIISIQE